MNTRDPVLWEKIKQEAKKKFTAFPSAYASFWMVNQYKKRGGKYKGTKNKDNELTRWKQEKWVNICKKLKNGKYAPCGRSKADGNSKYPACRPSIRINQNTPKTVYEMTPQEIARKCKAKQRNPSRKQSKY